MDDKGWEEFLKRHGLVDPFVAEKEKQEALAAAAKVAKAEAKAAAKAAAKTATKAATQKTFNEIKEILLSNGVDIEQISQEKGLNLSARFS